MRIGMIADFVTRGGDLASDGVQRRTLAPHMKNVALTLCSARSSSSAGVDSLGPSSKVSARRDASCRHDRRTAQPRTRIFHARRKRPGPTAAAAGEEEFPRPRPMSRKGVFGGGYASVLRFFENAKAAQIGIGVIDGPLRRELRRPIKKPGTGRAMAWPMRMMSMRETQSRIVGMGAGKIVQNRVAPVAPVLFEQQLPHLGREAGAASAQ